LRDREEPADDGPAEQRDQHHHRQRLYNVNMAATILTALVPLALYFISGRWFVRGIAAGAVKG
jgi:ABC-type glycerol-3-phosphate transport system permease component